MSNDKLQTIQIQDPYDPEHFLMMQFTAEERKLCDSGWFNVAKLISFCHEKISSYSHHLLY